MTTSRMVVVLRSELGTQLSLAQKEEVEIKRKYEEEIGLYAKGAKESKGTKIWMASVTKIRRLERAIHALGALQLGDIEDKEL